MKIITNFFSDYSEIVKQNLESFGYTDLPSDLKKILHIYYNYQLRIVHSAQRVIKKDRNFTCPSNLLNGLQSIEDKIIQGIDITPHLSRNLKRNDYDDPLLNDWGIHHLHLGNTIESDGFINRTDPVLFVRFTNDIAYFITISNHGTWSNKDMIKILHDNWPESLEIYKMEGILDITPNPSSADIKEYRKANINSIIEIDNTFYFSIGGGYMTSGISFHVVRQTDDVMYKIKLMEQQFKNKSNEIAKDIKNRFGKFDFIHFKFIVIKSSREAFAVSEAFKLKIKVGEL